MADGNSDQCDISQDLTSISDISPKEPCLATQGSSLHQIDGSRESQGVDGSRFGQDLSPCSTDKKKGPLPGQTPEGVNEENSIKTLATDLSYENNGRNDVTLVSPKDSVACAGSENGINSKLSSDQAMKCNSLSEQSVKSTDLLQTSDIQMHSENVHVNSESGTSAEIEDDVKVCDICGDAGVEEWLAICSRCSDGAEHIYCMRIRLDEVPQGDWLCEECQLKEEAQNCSVMKSEAESGTTEEPCKNGSSQNTGTAISAISCPPVESELIVPAVTGSNKEGTEISIKQRAANQEVSSKPNEEAPETCDGLTSCVVPKKTTLLSRESSFSKSDMGRVKSPKALISGQSENIVLNSPRSLISSDSDSLRFQSCTDTLKGYLSKSFSFNSSKVPKVKQFTGNIPQKQNVIREYNSSGTKKEGPVRTITKAASFRNASVGCSSNENKTDSVNLTLSDALKSVKQLKEKSSIDKKLSFLSERPSGKPSLVSGTNFTSPKPDVRVAQYDGNSKRMVEPGNPGIRKGPNDANTSRMVEPGNSGIRKGLNDANTTEMKRQSFSQSRCSGSASAGRSEDQKAFPLAPKVTESMQREDRSKDPTFFSGLKSPGPSGSRILRCQRCNETGHSTHCCGVDKLRVSALKPSSDRSTKDCGIKAKLKDNVETPVMKPKDKKLIRSPEQTEEVSTSAADPSSEPTSSDHVTSSVTYSKNIPSVEGTADVQKISSSSFSNIKAPVTAHVKHKVADQKNSVPAPKRDGINLDCNITDVLQVKPVSHLVSDQAVTSTFMTAVIPELEYVWQGAFDILRTGKDMATYDGFQAHLSNCVSPEALKVATKFPYRIQFEEVPRKSLWPSCLWTNGPKENNIGLFFFAKDIESYEKYYEKQLDNMIKNDLALRASVSAVDLLIFPSNLLPEDCQRWNKLFFFWGVFRRRKDGLFRGLPTRGEKLLMPNFSNVTLARSVPNRIPSGLFISTDGSIIEDLQQELSRPNRSLKSKDTLHQSNADAGISLEQTSGMLSGSWSSNKDHEPTCVAYCPEPKIDIDIERLPTEGEIAESSLGNVGNIPDCRENARCMHDNAAENAKSEVLMKLTVNCVKGEASVDNGLLENVVDLDQSKEEPKSTHKRLYSDSEQTFEQFSYHVQEVSGEKMLKNTSGTENKKLKLNNGGHASNGSSDGISAWMCPRIHPLAVSVDDGTYDKNVPESSLTAGTTLSEVNCPPRNLFAGDKSPAVSMKQKEPVFVLSSDEEEPPESSTPDLELALGGNKRQKMPEIFPLFSPKVEMTGRDKLPASSVEVADDELASLSLSLAVPVSKKATHTPNEQRLPDKPCINKSLLLFRGFPES